MGVERLHQVLRRQRLAASVRRAHRFAAAAAHARLGVQQVLPCEVLQLSHAELFQLLVLEVDVGQRPLRLKRTAVHGGRDQQHVHELRVHPVRQDPEGDGHMEPP